MSWNEVHAYYAALRRAEDELNHSGDGVPVWHRDYADIFGTPERLTQALCTHWHNLVRAQVECESPQNWRRIMDINRLAAAHPGLAAAVARAAVGKPAGRTDVELVGAA